MRNQVVHVLLRDKIVGIDSILSTCMEIHGKCNYRFNFISFERLTYEHIIKDNIVIRDAINSIGKMELVSSDKYKSKIISKIFFILYFLTVIFRVAFKNDYIMHSDHLHVNPLALIRRLFKKSHIIFVERKSFNVRNDMSIVDFNTLNSRSIYDKRLTPKEISKYDVDMYSNLPLLYAGTLIGYNKEWNYFKHPAASGSNKIIINGVRRGKYWINFVNKNASAYIENEIPLLEFKSDKILVFIATRITRKSDIDLIIEFVNAIKVLSKYTQIFPLFIKLHSFSDICFINELLDVAIIEKYKPRYVITTLHPAVLSTKSVISVFANEGTVMAEFSEFGTPVVDLQIHEYVLPDSSLFMSLKLPEDKLKNRYNSRNKSSDCTFVDSNSFGNFMKDIIKKSFVSGHTRSIVASTYKNFTHMNSCNFDDINKSLI